MISDDDLLLYHYGDVLDADEQRRIAAAVRAQPELAARMRKLVAQLDAAAMSGEAPVPADVERRWQAALERAVLEESAHVGKTVWFSRALASAASIAVVTMLGVFAWNAWISDRSAITTVSVPSTPAEEQGLRWHLANTEQQLATLDTMNDEQRAALIDTVIAQNRLYAAAAEKAGEQRLARALRAFMPILEDLATNESPRDLSQLNFELRVMQARLAAESLDATAHSQTSPTSF